MESGAIIFDGNKFVFNPKDYYSAMEWIQKEHRGSPETLKMMQKVFLCREHIWPPFINPIDQIEASDYAATHKSIERK